MRIVRQYGPWLVPALAALAVGLARAGVPELWRDEVSSWSASGRRLGELFALLRNVDASNGAYYVLLHGWTQVFGDSPTALRLPSALAMAGAAALTALTARRLFASPAAGLAAGLLLATVPQVSRYAQEARSYAVVTCAVAGATWCLLRALDRPGAARWACYALCTAAAGLFHLVALSALVGQLPMVLLAARRPGRRALLWQWPAAATAGLLPTVPLILLGHHQSGRQLSWLAAPTRRDLQFVWQDVFGSYHVLYTFLVLGLIALVWRPTSGAAVRLLAAAVLPVTVVWFVSRHGGTSYFLARYLLFTLPAWAALAGGGVGVLYALLPRAARSAPVAVALALAVAAVPAWQGLDAQRALRTAVGHTDTDYRGAAAIVAAGYRPGDGLVTAGGTESWMMVGPAVAYYLPRSIRPQAMFVQESAVSADDLFPVECRVPAACTGDGSRAWVVTIGTGSDPFRDLPAAQALVLRTDFTPAEVRQIPGLTVSLLVRR
jgi:mannosyltransferase